MKPFRLIKNSISMIVMSTLLAACTKILPQKTQEQLNSQTSQCLRMTQQYAMATVLAKANIQMIQIGDKIRLILPTDQFFYAHANHLKTNQINTLRQIAQFIDTYHTTYVSVIGYTDTVGNYNRNLALSRAQAQIIAHYLWHYRISVGLITATGKACHQPIALNTGPMGRKYNCRIEIHFRLAPPQNVFH